MKDKTTTLSLLISTYNWVGALALTLDSALNQTVAPDEILIADDGSRGDTAELIKEYQKKTEIPIVHIWQENTGFRAGKIRNKAIAAGHHPYIVQIDGDIVMDKNFIKDHHKLAEKGFFVAGGRILTTKKLYDRLVSGKKEWGKLNFLSSGLEFSHRINAIRIPMLRDYMKTRYKKDKYWGRGCNMAFWRDDIISVNGYDESIDGWGEEDTDLIIRLTTLGRRRNSAKFGAIGYHLDHPIRDKSNKERNLSIRDDNMRAKRIFVANGIDKYIIK